MDKFPIPNITVTDHVRSRTIGQAFALGCNGKIISVRHSTAWDKVGRLYTERHIASYGLLRGSSDTLNRAKTFFYIDQGYYGKGPEFSGYYRVCYNGLIHSGKGDFPSKKLDGFNLKFKDWRKTGDHIVIVPPSKFVRAFYQGIIDDWTDKTVYTLAKYSDRKILISHKSSKVPIDEALKNAWCLVTFHSNTMTTALMNGIPIISTSPDRPIGKLEDIEKPLKNRGFLKNLAHYQWTIPEMKSGKCWRQINEYF